MHKTKENMDLVIKKGIKADMERIEDFFYKLMCKVHMSDVGMTNWIKEEIREMAHGKIITEEVAKNWVMNMKPCGQHWTMEQTSAVMKQKGYSCNPIDWYVCCNMIHSDYNNIVKDNDELCFKMAYDFLNDDDAVKDKLYQYYKHIPKK